MVSSYQSEYEQSFAGRRNRRIDRNSTEQIDRGDLEWITELQDSRKRAAENKMRARGDHFSRDHLLQIPSQATRFWEPYYDSQPTVAIREARPNGAFHQYDTIEPDTYKYPAVKTLIRQDEYKIPVVSRDHPALELIRNDQRPEGMVSCGQQTDDLSHQTIIKYPVFYAPTKYSQSTQTNSLMSAENLPLRPAGITQTGSTIEDGVAPAEIYPAVVVNASPNNAARLDILRKAKYFDANDFASSTTPVLRSMPRSFSTRSLNRSQDRRSGFSPVRHDRRPSSSITTYEADFQKVRASSGNLKLHQGRGGSKSQQVPDCRSSGFDRPQKLGGTLQNGFARPSRRSSPVNKKSPSSLNANTQHSQRIPVETNMIVQADESKREKVRPSSRNGFSARQTPVRQPSPVAKVPERRSPERQFSAVRHAENTKSGGKGHFSAWIDL
ncbi:hypothetical protein RvY_05367-2 [Ramazzottius varieornatus]|uniref:Uncharacterized protein n=1 Tax=Ramazzottius varieornatus TaxID=947166 RepID=A0A1D1V3S8_RAMVA|nr:hypothetical protein RvY_05367-2 [Ramazzottius varieornatus]